MPLSFALGTRHGARRTSACRRRSERGISVIPVVAVALIALACGAWLAVALWATVSGRRAAAAAREVVDGCARMAALLETGPALLLIVAADGTISGSRRLAKALGVDALPPRWLGLFGEGAPFSADEAALLGRHLADAAAGASVSTTLRPAGSARAFRLDGGPAPTGFGERAAVFWFIDVTEAQGAAAAVAARLERRSTALDALSALIEAAPFPIWHRGSDLGLAMVNGAYVAAVEARDAADVIGAGIELIDDADGLGPEAAARQVVEQQQAAYRTVPATVSGERRMMQVVEVPLGPNGVAGYAIDVEDQEQARTELSRFVRAQRDMLDRLSAGVAQFGRDRSLIFFNQPFARLFSLTPDFLGDRPEFDRVIEAMREAGNLPEVRDFPDWREEHRGWFTSGLAAEEEDWQLSGGRHLRVVAQPLPDGGLLTIFEDQTERMKLAAEYDKLQRARSASFDNLFEAVAVFNQDGRLNLWNNRFKELWGLEEEQLAAHPRVDTLAPLLAPKLKRASHAGLVRELVRSATVERKQRTGRVSFVDGREFEFAAVPLPDSALFTMLDISDSRKVEAALRERTEALEEADRLKTAFVSNMSYELRTPLTSIGGFAEMLAEGYGGELPPVAAEYVTAILDSVGRLSALIDNVLDLTQSDTGSLLLAEDEVDLAALVAEAAAKVEEAAARGGLDFVVEIAPEVGIVTGDPRRLGQALGNVLKNALAYTQAGGRVLLHAEGDRDEARIVVSDNGAGIAPADQARVFDRFSRTAEGRNGEEEAAVGLGLPLARQFIEAHGGAIALESAVGQGTTVTIRLPRTAEQRAGWPAAQAAP